MMSLSYESSIVMIVLLAIISFVFLQGCIFSIGNREISLAFMLRFLIRRRGIAGRDCSFRAVSAPFRQLFSLLDRYRRGRRAPARAHLYLRSAPLRRRKCHDVFRLVFGRVGGGLDEL